MTMRAVKNNQLKEIPAETKDAAKQHDQNLQSHSWEDDFKLNSDGAIKVRSIYNIKLLIENDDLLKEAIAYDEFAGMVVVLKDVPVLKIKRGFWNDADDAILRNYLETRYNLLFGKDNISDAVINVSREHTINPVKERIEKAEWDGVSRAEKYFVDYLGAENNEYTKAITKIWLTGLVARVYKPGCKFEVVPILEGKQGLGKSTAAKVLYPDKFNDSLAGLGQNKDDYQQLQGSWIIEIAELSAMKKTEIEKTKNFISAMVDNYRSSYGHYSLPHERKCGFIGTTNQSDYLKDATGERRFFPIKCGVNEPVKNVWKPDEKEINQVLAEAKTWFDNDEPLYPSKDVMEIAKTYQEKAKTIDPLEEAIKDFVSLKVPDNWDDLSLNDKQLFVKHQGNVSETPWLESKFSDNYVPLNHTTATEILAVLFNKTPDKYLMGKTQSEAKKIKLIMDNLDGWEYKRLRTNGKQIRAYTRTNL